MLQLYPAAIGKGKIEASTPSSNTGCLKTKTRCRIDWLGVSFPGSVLPQNIEEFSLTLFKRIARHLRGAGWTLDRKARGFNGFENGARLCYRGDLRASVQWGGASQRGRVFLELRGALCAILDRRDWISLYHMICKYQGRISRCDLALDDLEGAHFKVEDIRDRVNASPGDFKQVGRLQGNRVTVTKWVESETGKTVYFGGGSVRHVVYEKGLQLGHTVQGKEHPSWVRWEARFTRQSRMEIENHIVHPDYWVPMLLGSCKYLHDAFDGGPLRATYAVAKAKQEPIETAARSLVWLRNQAGPMIADLVRIMGSDLFLEVVSRQGDDTGLGGLNRMDVDAIAEDYNRLRAGAIAQHASARAGSPLEDTVYW